MPGKINSLLKRPAVIFTGDAEKRRTKRAQKARKAKWELLITESEQEATTFAKENGWADKKVQVRRSGIYFTVEPFEKDCTCPDILKFNDYFTGEEYV